MNPDTLEHIYRQHHHKIFLCALAITGRKDLAEDAVHEGMARLCQTETNPDNPLWYVMKTVRNTAIDMSSKDRKQEKTVDRLRVFRRHTSNDNGRRPDPILVQQVERALGQLSRNKRETLILKFWGGLTFQEISALQRRSVNTVASDYRRALAKLRSLENE